MNNKVSIALIFVSLVLVALCSQITTKDITFSTSGWKVSDYKPLQLITLGNIKSKNQFS
jgi:hypothetical protein